MRDGALPSPANQALVLSGVVEAANAESWKVNLIEVFDQPWKRLLEGAVGGYRGCSATTRQLKFHWGEPVSNHPEWLIEAALGICAAFLVFATAWFHAARTMQMRRAGDRVSPSRHPLSAPDSCSAVPRSACPWNHPNLVTACARPG